MDRPSGRHHDTNRIPKRLRHDLKRLYDGEMTVPPAVDAVVMASARTRFARSRRARMLMRSLSFGAAAASVVLVVLLMDRYVNPGSSWFSPAATAMREDIDGNGQVDILDAFTLARRIETSQTPDKSWDVNHDGTVDRLDVDAIALSAVRLDHGVVQ